MASSHLSLRRWYNHYNKYYFNSELPANTRLIWTALHKDHAQMEEGEIHLDPSLALYPRFMRIMLMHEMIHLHKPKLGHGKKFKAEVKRLFDLGAYSYVL